MMQDKIDFVKMHGLGNDFVIIDGRKHNLTLNSDMAKRISHRQRGVGCDQIIVMRAPNPITPADCFIEIFNADGSQIGACGNATRCVAAILMGEKNKTEVVIQTPAMLDKPLHCYWATKKNVTVNMGEPRFKSREFAFPEGLDPIHLKINRDGLQDPVAVNMGNPHCVFIVDDCEAVELMRLGPVFEHHIYFPNRVNVGVAEIIDRQNIKLRVWERGAGETLACGTGACAAVVATYTRGLTDKKVTVYVRGGELFIDWKEDGSVYMTGPISPSFTGHFDWSLLYS